MTSCSPCPFTFTWGPPTLNRNRSPRPRVKLAPERRLVTGLTNIFACVRPYPLPCGEEDGGNPSPLLTLPHLPHSALQPSESRPPSLVRSKLAWFNQSRFPTSRGTIVSFRSSYASNNPKGNYILGAQAKELFHVRFHDDDLPLCSRAAGDWQGRGFHEGFSAWTTMERRS